MKFPDPPLRFPVDERGDRPQKNWVGYFRDASRILLKYLGNTNGGNFSTSNGLMVTDSNGVPTTLSNVTASSMTNFTPLNQDGIVGASTGWDDLRFEAASLGSVRNAPALGWTSLNGVNLVTRAFTDESVAGNEKEVVFVAQMPHGYARDRGANSNIILHIHWAANHIANTNAVMGLEVTWANIGHRWPPNQFFYCNLPIWTGNVTNLHKYTTIAQLDGANKTESSVVCCRLWRNSSNTNDTYTNTVWLVTADFHIQREKFGSRNEIPGVYQWLCRILEMGLE